MVNKDYILRLAEEIGRSLSILLGLRKYRQSEEALIYIDNLLLRHIGLSSRFINSLSVEMLLKTFSPMGILNVQACLWCAVLLKAEGDIYEDQENASESYYRSIKSLHLFLAALLHDPIAADSELYLQVEELIKKLDAYELPAATKLQLFPYYEHLGKYAKAEDILFEQVEADTTNRALIERGQAFYQRLLTKSDADLLAGDLSREEAREGLEQLQNAL